MGGTPMRSLAFTDGSIPDDLETRYPAVTILCSPRDQYYSGASLRCSCHGRWYARGHGRAER